MVKRLLELDAMILVGLQRWRPTLLTRFMRTLTRLGDASTWVLVCLVLLAAGGQSRQHGMLLATATVLATSAAQLVKRTCQRPRPSAGIRGFVSLVENPDVWSFPSGHTAAGFAAAIALAGAGPWLGALNATLAVGIALSRMYLGAHYPLDVAAGAVIGAASGVAARLLIGLA